MSPNLSGCPAQFESLNLSSPWCEGNRLQNDHLAIDCDDHSCLPVQQEFYNCKRLFGWLTSPASKLSPNNLPTLSGRTFVVMEGAGKLVNYSPLHLNQIETCVFQCLH